MEGPGEVSVYLSRGLPSEDTHYVSIVHRRARDLYLLFPPQVRGWYAAVTAWWEYGWNGLCTARRGEELLLGKLASCAPFWSLAGRTAWAAGRQPCSGARVVITPLSVQQSRSHSHICANSSYSQAKGWRLLSPVQDKKRTIPAAHLKQSKLSIDLQPRHYSCFSGGGVLPFGSPLHKLFPNTPLTFPLGWKSF